MMSSTTINATNDGDKLSSSVPTGELSPPSLPPRKRTRTGCLKCRLRRRKCDEGKPSCRRCRNGGYDCRYPSGLKFLEKNILTISEANESQPAANNYMRVEFLQPNASLPRNKRGRPPRQKYLAAITTSPRVPSSSESGDSALGKDREVSSGPTDIGDGGSPAQVGEVETLENDNGETAGSQDQVATDPPPSLEPPVTTAEIPDPCYYDTDPPLSVPTTLSSHFTDLSASLTPWLAIPYTSTADSTNLYGSESVETTTVRNGFSMYEGSALGNGVGQGSVMSPTAMSVTISDLTPRYVPGVTTFGPLAATLRADDEDVSTMSIMAPSPGSTNSSMPNIGLLDLLRHFRYEVSPWLDITNLSQPFGILLPQLAITSKRIFWAMLELSGASLLGKRWNGIHSLTLPKMYVGTESAFGITTDESIVFLLKTTRSLILSSPPHWSKLLHEFYQNVSGESAAAMSPQLRHSCHSLLLRFDLAHALSTNTPILDPCHPIIAALSIWTPRTHEQQVHHTALQPLLLCARAVNLCYSESPGSNRTTSWKSLTEDLSLWYTQRPAEFHPMLSLDPNPSTTDDDSPNELLFPIIIFTSGAALFANQLYHTAMLLLLQHKPRTVALESWRSSVLSPLWHAQRICGIAQGSQERESRDWGLVSSVYLAGQAMTYEPQQMAVLAILEQIQMETGWDMGWYIKSLKGVWMS